MLTALVKIVADVAQPLAKHGFVGAVLSSVSVTRSCPLTLPATSWPSTKSRFSPSAPKAPVATLKATPLHWQLAPTTFVSVAAPSRGAAADAARQQQVVVARRAQA